MRKHQTYACTHACINIQIYTHIHNSISYSYIYATRGNLYGFTEFINKCYRCISLNANHIFIIVKFQSYTERKYYSHMQSSILIANDNNLQKYNSYTK